MEVGWFCPPLLDRVKPLDLKGSNSQTKGHSNDSGHPSINSNVVICMGSPSKTSGCVNLVETKPLLGYNQNQVQFHSETKTSVKD